MKQFLILLGTALAFCSCAPQSEPAATRTTDRILAELRNPASKNVVVVSHRGDWRNWPENSLDAIESVIGMGVDVMELDLKLTKDSVLVLCHDKTIDRTTNGHGRVCDITYDSIQRCLLRTGHGVKTDLRMPTLRDALKVCKDRIVVNIDQGYEYYDLALAVTEELGVTEFTPERLTQYIFDSVRERELVYVNRTVYDGPVTPSDETDGGRFWTIGEILRTLGTGLFTPNFESEFRRVFLTDDGIA